MPPCSPPPSSPPVLPLLGSSTPPEFPSLPLTPRTAPPSSPPVQRDLETPLSRVIQFALHLPFQTEDLVLSDITPTRYRQLLAALENAVLVGGKTADTVRHFYNPSTGIFKARCMPSQVHDAGLRLSTELYMTMGVTRFFPLDELKMLAMEFGTDNVLPRSRRRARAPNARKHSAIKKQGDVTFTYGGIVGGSRSALRAFPSVVFEIGFTESYIDLVEDAKQWLINSAGAVRLVVLIKLAEQRLDGTSDESIDHDGGSVSSEDTESVDSAGSDPESYQSLLEICRTEDWVGPITGFLEFWRYDPIAVDISMQGTRVDFLPVPADPQPRVIISRADFKGNHATPTDFDQFISLDLNRYRELIAEATVKLAHTRLVSHLKAKRAESRTGDGDRDGDGDYVLESE